MTVITEKILRSGPVSRRTAIRGAAATGVGLVTVVLPGAAAAISSEVAAATTSTTTTMAAAPSGGYSEDGAADPGMRAINAVPVVTTSGSVEVSGSDTAG